MMDSKKMFIRITTWVFSPAPQLHVLVLTEIDCAEKLPLYLRMSTDFRVNVTESAEDDVNLRVSTGSWAAIDKGCRRQC